MIIRNDLSSWLAVYKTTERGVQTPDPVTNYVYLCHWTSSVAQITHVDIDGYI